MTRRHERPRSARFTPPSGRFLGDPRAIERLLIGLIALHSLAVGAFLLGFTDWSVAFGGWGRAQPRFFAQQAGAFHFVVALGYLYEHFRYGGIGLLVLAKSIAFVFLAATTLAAEELVWTVPLSALGDGLMAIAAVAVHRWARRSED